MELSCQAATVRFGGFEALRGVSAVFPAGSRTLVLGRAGSGKTSLLKLLAGLRPPDTGAVLWQSRSLSTLSWQQRREHQARMGLVFQTDALFDSLTVLENVLLPLRRRRVPEAEAQSRANEVLSSVGLAAALDAHSEALSGGMRKRTGLARAVAARPEVLLADDPLAGLDPGTARQVCEVLDRVAEGRTLIVAATEPPYPLRFERWIYLREGRITHDGPPNRALLDEDEEPGVTP